MGSDTWQLERDLYLASQGLSVEIGERLGPADVTRLQLEIQTIQARCQHVPNPAHPERCFKCGAPPVAKAEPRPGPVKVRQPPLAGRKVGT